jgi:signal transduction histidine kinase
MRVSGRIATGTGIATVLLLGVLAWDLAIIRRLVEVAQELSQVSLRTSILALEQDRLLTRIDEFTRKYAVTGDEAYAERLSGLRLAFAVKLVELSGLRLSEEERREVGRLSRLWERYRRSATGYREPSEDSQLWGTEGGDELLSRLNEVQLQVRRVDGVAQDAVSLASGRATLVSRRAERLSGLVVALAVIASVVILWLTVRSIRRPLSRLAAGTKAVAEGDLSVQLDGSSRDEFGRLAESFNQMVRRLAELDQVKKDFLSHVSHELKTPLASMQETNELLLEEIPGPLNERQRRFLTLNLESSLRLSSMIARLLDLSRLEAGVMEYDLREHDLAELVRAGVEGFEARSREAEVDVELILPLEPVEVKCDHDRIIQVVGNLVDNALRFSSRGDVVEVVVHPLQAAYRDKGPACVEVRDRGPGVPEDQKDLVFERFHQVPRAGGRGNERGVGLGLAICREIIEAHGGQIAVRDRQQGGSAFYFTLPFSD